MATTEDIKRRIQQLYSTNPNIHMNVSLSRPSIHLTNAPAVIKGVYRHIFQIEECSNGTTQHHTLQYNDVLTKHIEILELSDMTE